MLRSCGGSPQSRSENGRADCTQPRRRRRRFVPWEHRGGVALRSCGGSPQSRSENGRATTQPRRRRNGASGGASLATLWLVWLENIRVRSWRTRAVLTGTGGMASSPQAASAALGVVRVAGLWAGSGECRLERLLRVARGSERSRALLPRRGVGGLQAIDGAPVWHGVPKRAVVSKPIPWGAETRRGDRLRLRSRGAPVLVVGPSSATRWPDSGVLVLGSIGGALRFAHAVGRHSPVQRTGEQLHNRGVGATERPAEPSLLESAVWLSSAGRVVVVGRDSVRGMSGSGLQQAAGRRRGSAWRGGGGQGSPPNPAAGEDRRRNAV